MKKREEARRILVNVRTLSLKDILELWQREIDFPAGIMERELRRAVLNLEMDWRRGELIDPLKPDDELPGMDKLVDRDWLLEFCGKGDWPFPRFWFPDLQEENRLQGRPSLRDKVLHEFAERIKRSETLGTISQEARAIEGELRAQGYEKGIQSKTIQKHIRGPYDEWKRG